MLAPVSPVDQLTLQLEHTFSAESTKSSPLQSSVDAEAETIGAAGRVAVVTRMALDAGPSPQVFSGLLTVAEKTPSVATIILRPVAPFDQCTIQSGQTFSAESNTESPEQRVVVPEAEIKAASGRTSETTRIALEAGPSPQVLNREAV